MSVSTSEVRRVRRMIAETSATSAFSDADIAAAISRYPREDARGEAPFRKTKTASGALAPNPDWMPTYDLHAAAAELWEIKAADLAANYDFAADGGTYHRSQAVDHAMRMVRWHQARRSPTTITLRPEPAASGMEGGDAS